VGNAAWNLPAGLAPRGGAWGLATRPKLPSASIQWTLPASLSSCANEDDRSLSSDALGINVTRVRSM